MGKTATAATSNLSKVSSTTYGVVSALSLDDFKFSNVPVMLSSDNAGVSGLKGYLGILGSEIINRFDLIIDYKSLKLYLKPNHLFSKKFALPPSIKIAKVGKDFMISEVSKNSDAYKKGVRAGQKIISVNDKKSDDIGYYRDFL